MHSPVFFRVNQSTQIFTGFQKRLINIKAFIYYGNPKSTLKLINQKKTAHRQLLIF